MKSKVINVTYRKDSETFPQWMKYEVTLLHQDGTTQTIPAYGKDLQDALSRVVHDKRVEKVEKQVKRIPEIIWVILWFGYILGWVMLTYEISPYNRFNGLFFLGGIFIITLVTLWAKNWFRMRNRNEMESK